jgi:hypothetical protein
LPFGEVDYSHITLVLLSIADNRDEQGCGWW